jgi:hypothetical protein
LQIQKVMRERDQANSTSMQIRGDFEKLLLQSNQVESDSLSWQFEKQHVNSIDRIYFNYVINWAPIRIDSMMLKANCLIRKSSVWS